MTSARHVQSFKKGAPGPAELQDHLFLKHTTNGASDQSQPLPLYIVGPSVSWAKLLSLSNSFTRKLVLLLICEHTAYA